MKLTSALLLIVSLALGACIGVLITDNNTLRNELSDRVSVIESMVWDGERVPRIYITKGTVYATDGEIVVKDMDNNKKR